MTRLILANWLLEPSTETLVLTQPFAIQDLTDPVDLTMPNEMIVEATVITSRSAGYSQNITCQSPLRTVTLLP